MLPALLEKLGGYRSYHVGKWHQGLQSLECVPYRRGFSGGSFGYLGGECDHVDQTSAPGVCGCTDASGGCVDLWRDETAALGENGTYNGYRFTRQAVEYIEAHPRDVPLFLFASWQAVHGPYEVPSRFRELFGPDEPCPDTGKPSGSPDCCSWTEQSAAEPCDVSSAEGVCKCPSDAMRFQPPDFRCPPGGQCTRRYMLAMLAALDESVANVTDALRRTGMYNQSVVVFSSDNGGAVADCDHFDPGCQLGAMNNYPLRGGKFSYFEGGVRLASFVHSPLLPLATHGTVAEGTLAIADLYATFAHLASGGAAMTGAPHERWMAELSASEARLATARGLPHPYGCREHSPCTFPVDGVSQWDYWAGRAPEPRTELLLGTRQGGALLQGSLKLVLGRQQPDWWYGPFSPNCTNGTGLHDPATNCGLGCLFDLALDPGEHVNLRLEPGRQPDFERLLARFKELAPWWTNGTEAEQTQQQAAPWAAHESPRERACTAMRMEWGGHWGPWDGEALARSTSWAGGWAWAMIGLSQGSCWWAW